MMYCHKNWALTLGLACVALPAYAVEFDKLLPSKTEKVVVINVRQILDSAFYKEFGANPVKTLLKDDKLAWLERGLKATGFDPFKDIDTILIAGPNRPFPDPKDLKTSLMPGLHEIETKLAFFLIPKTEESLIIVRGKFDESRIIGFAEASARKLKSVKEKSLTVHEVELPTGDLVYLSFADKNTLVFTRDRKLLVASASGQREKPTVRLIDGLGKVTGKESIYVVSVLTDDQKKLLPKDLQPVLGFGTVLPTDIQLLLFSETIVSTATLTDGVDLKLTLSHKADAKRADSMKKFIEILGEAIVSDNGLAKDLPSVKHIKGKVALSTNSIIIDLKLTGADINKIIKSK